MCSRREAERKIEDGSVIVNGKPAQIGQSVDPDTDVVEVDGIRLKGPVAERVVLAMNKPKGCVCTNSDPFGARTVFEILPEPYSKMKLFCCGRLDKNTEGLLILTNDGEFANKLTHPSSGIVKRYRALLNRDFDGALIPVLTRGVVCDGEKLHAERILRDNTPGVSDSARRVEVWLHQGRKREIRRMFEAVGYFVKELKRYQIGKYVLRGLASGACKPLGKAEIAKLMEK